MYNVVIFGYNFNHLKSETFIHILSKHNINIVAYIGANAVKLNLPQKLHKKSIPSFTTYHPKELCQKYNIPFFEAVHNSKETEEIIKQTKANLGIVSGARILKSNIIQSLEHGIVNFHPGKIPEASGLDGLFWSIYKDIKPFVTTHFIDEKIDAGKMIYEQEVEVYQDDRIEDIKHRISLTENYEFEKLCSEFLSKDIEIESNTISNYINANKPMEIEDQQIVLNKFESWKEKVACR